MSKKEKYTVGFESSLNEFVNELKQYVSTETGDWTIKGFIDVYKNIYTISSDLKRLVRFIYKLKE